MNKATTANTRHARLGKIFIVRTPSNYRLLCFLDNIGSGKRAFNAETTGRAGLRSTRTRKQTRAYDLVSTKSRFRRLLAIDFTIVIERYASTKVGDGLAAI